ncbi:MAG: 4-alpha-glucanotransferase [Clostridia bacterium]|nr:4-alpha-glucanotransferase [Clostridia bacterium]
MENKRASGVLLHITSLPNKYGLGTISIEAYDFVRMLAKARVKYWQILPLNHCGYGMSPYSAYSVFAGNPYFIDLREFLSEEELKKFGIVEKGNSKLNLEDMQKKLFNAFWYFYDKCRNKFDIEDFKKENASWLYDYARFMAIKQIHGNIPWWEFPNNLDKCELGSNKKFDEKYGKVFDFYVFLQYIFFMQWTRLKAYANSLGVKIVGDMAIYSAMDGADVWANRELFKCDAQGKPTVVSGTPPDAFTEDGQLWGNPIYNYKKMEKDNYAWWINRVRVASKLFDTVRIDHFRAFASYWAVPAKDETAKNGKWEVGPGKKLYDLMCNSTDMDFFVEDLGELTDDVIKLRDRLKCAGMKVLQYAFDCDLAKGFLPHNYEKNCVAYIGTHDNDTFKGFLEKLDDNRLSLYARYFGAEKENIDDIIDKAIRYMLQSQANLCVITIQDLLKLNGDYRMNVPGTIEGNWLFQLKNLNFEKEMESLADMIDIYQRI